MLFVCLHICAGRIKYSMISRLELSGDMCYYSCCWKRYLKGAILVKHFLDTSTRPRKQLFWPSNRPRSLALGYLLMEGDLSGWSLKALPHDNTLTWCLRILPIDYFKGWKLDDLSNGNYGTNLLPGWYSRLSISQYERIIEARTCHPCVVRHLPNFWINLQGCI